MTNNANEALEPCPLCGSAARMEFGGEVGRYDQYDINCTGCGLYFHGPVVAEGGAAKAATAEAWNRRATAAVVKQDLTGESVITIRLDRRLGMYGQAYDGPNPCRAYTFKHQPANQHAYALGNAHADARAMSAGDKIDLGLNLLKALEAEGFGVFALDHPESPGQIGTEVEGAQPLR